MSNPKSLGGSQVPPPFLAPENHAPPRRDASCTSRSSGKKLLSSPQNPHPLHSLHFSACIQCKATITSFSRWRRARFSTISSVMIFVLLKNPERPIQTFLFSCVCGICVLLSDFSNEAGTSSSAQYYAALHCYSGSRLLSRHNVYTILP